jgi:aflatoxin B1 aldehyde reductase
LEQGCEYWVRHTISKPLIFAQNLVGQVYSGHYASPAVQASVETVQAAAGKHQIDGHSAALRWAKYHSALDGEHGDGIIFGVSSMKQLEKTLAALEAGPLPEDLVEAINAVYGSFEEGEAPPYHL